MEELEITLTRKEVFIMPGFDGTGPMGMGSMTGGARGWCNPYATTAVPVNSRPIAGRGYGRRQDWGRGFARPHRGMGMQPWRNFGVPGLMPDQARTSDNRVQELALLKNQAEALRAELDAVERRIHEAESEKRESE